MAVRDALAPGRAAALLVLDLYGAWSLVTRVNSASARSSGAAWPGFTGPNRPLRAGARLEPVRDTGGDAVGEPIGQAHQGDGALVSGRIDGARIVVSLPLAGVDLTIDLF